MKFSTECWVMILTKGKSKELGGELVSVPLCLPQIPHELACLGLNEVRSVTKPWQECAPPALSMPPHLKWMCELRASGWEASRWLTGNGQGCCSWDSLLGGMGWSSVDVGTARNKLEDLGVDGSAVLKRILRTKWGVGVDWCGSALGQVVEVL